MKRLWIALGATLLVAACGSTDAPATQLDEPGVAEPPSGGFEAPIFFSGNTPQSGGEDAELGGRLVLVDDCVLLENEGSFSLVVWPAGSTWDPVSNKLSLSNGTEIGIGDMVRGGGGYSEPSSLEQVVGTKGVTALRRCNEIAMPGSPDLEVALVNGDPSELEVSPTG